MQMQDAHKEMKSRFLLIDVFLRGRGNRIDGQEAGGMFGH